jgi:hypothetical protein
MNVSNVSSVTNTNPPAAPATARPRPAGDHDGDADDRAGAVSGAAATGPVEAAENGKLNVQA